MKTYPKMTTRERVDKCVEILRNDPELMEPSDFHELKRRHNVDWWAWRFYSGAVIASMALSRKTSHQSVVKRIITLSIMPVLGMGTTFYTTHQYAYLIRVLSLKYLSGLNDQQLQNYNIIRESHL